MQTALKVWIRIIYISERNQVDTKYCCCSRRVGQAEKGYPQPKILVQNESLISRLAWLVCGVRNLKLQECF
jgi:hypothetical protein